MRDDDYFPAVTVALELASWPCRTTYVVEAAAVYDTQLMLVRHHRMLEEEVEAMAMLRLISWCCPVPPYPCLKVDSKKKVPVVRTYLP